jgi:hypothetical protein
VKVLSDYNLLLGASMLSTLD